MIAAAIILCAIFLATVAALLSVAIPGIYGNRRPQARMPPPCRGESTELCEALERDFGKARH